MNNQDELRHLSNLDNNISTINSNITNIYSTLNILSNSILMNQRQTLLNELRTPPPRHNLFSPTSSIFTTPSPPMFRTPRHYPTTTSATASPNTSSIPSSNVYPVPTNTTNTNTMSATASPNTSSIPSSNVYSVPTNTNTNTNTNTTSSTRTRNSLNTFLSSLFRNEIPSGYGIGNMEISVLSGVNPHEEEETIVISHHNIFNNTKIKLYSSVDTQDGEDGDVEDIPKCSICLENIEDNQIIREITKCKHIFHVDCADKWFENNIKCPNCRQDIRTEIVS